MASSASACGTVRGKPSRMNPLAQSACFTRLASMAMITSSGTSLPLSMMDLARWPISEPAATSARSMSPGGDLGDAFLLLQPLGLRAFTSAGRTQQYQIHRPRPLTRAFLISPSY